MSGGSISQNIAGSGGAIFANATDTSIDPPIQIGDGTYIKTSSTPNTNDVYLKNYNTRIKVSNFSTGWKIDSGGNLASN